jgi:hypothetical protein
MSISPDDLTLDPPSRVADVVAHLDTIQQQSETTAPRGQRDGLACFNYLYRSITQQILDTLETTDGFEDKNFVSMLDVEFARRYLDALERYAGDPASAPRSWRVLLDRRSDAGVAPLQFALAGVNAHVNFDLAFALVTTCDAIASPLGSDTQRRDYQRINEVFASQMASLRHHFEDLFERDLDRSALSSLNNHVDDVSVILARDAAWHHAQHLWTVRAEPRAMHEQTEATDLLVSLAGRGILAHV